MPLWTILTKCPAPFGAAVQVALLGGAVQLLASRRSRHVARARRQRRRKSDRGAGPRPFRRQSSCSSRAPGPTRRRWFPRPRNGCASPRVPWRAGCHRRNRNCRRRSGCRPLRGEAEGRRWLLSTTAAGTISQIARGFSSLATKILQRRASRRLLLAPIRSPPSATCRRRRTGGRLRAAAAPCSPPSFPAQSFRVA